MKKIYITPEIKKPNVFYIEPLLSTSWSIDDDEEAVEQGSAETNIWEDDSFSSSNIFADETEE